MTPTSSRDTAGVQRLYVLTGEPSGDAHAAAVVRALKAGAPEIEVRGMGGDALAAEGVTLVEHIRNTSVMGFAEVVRKLGFFRRLMARVKADIAAFDPDRIVLVYYPGFNLRLARWAHEQGWSVDMYIAPQVWAWKRGRIHAMARDLDRLYVILPFEAQHYGEVDLRVDYVGHPLADAIPARVDHSTDKSDAAAWRSRCGLPATGNLLALLPGSRLQEIERMLPSLTEAARQLPHLTPVVAGAPGRQPSDYTTEFPVLFGETSELYRHAAAGIITSGTATLEAALYGLPQVVAYRTSGVTYRLAKWFTQVRFISLVNLILDREAVPERIQQDCTPTALAETLKGVMSEAGQQAQMQAHSDLRTALSTKGAAQAVAQGLLREP
jgi:lipid-A-disaccharide synthase